MIYKEPIAYAVRHIDDHVRMNSRSGGFFTVVSDMVLENGGIVYGCVLDKNGKACHVRTTDRDIRDAMRGSKYVQSEMGMSYRNVEKDLQSGKCVLFSGTSCQVAALKNYLKNDYDNLICMDVVCHGVPSPLVWRDYLEWQLQRSDSDRIVGVEFRNKKKYGWRDHVETIYFEDGECIDSTVYTTLFYSHVVLRPACYVCPYKDKVHPGDITIADCWGIENVASDMDDNNGVSLVLINNEKGYKLFQNTTEWIMSKKVDLNLCMQTPLIRPFEKPKKRDRFWEDYSSKEFTYIAKKYGGYGRRNKIRKKLGKIKRKILN